MKKTLLLILFFATVLIAAHSQNTKTKFIKPDESSLVKDSSGMVYPYIIWNKMYQSGEYNLRMLNRTTGPEYLIAKLSDAELDARYSKMARPMKSTFFADGQKISSFSAKDIEGNKLKLKDLEGKVVVLNFWFIGCPPCRMEIPQLNDLSIKYGKDPNVVFIAIALDGEKDIRQYTKMMPFGYHLIEDGQIYADLYKIHLYPTNVVLDKQGKVMFQSVGYSPATPYWIKKTIEEAKQKGS